MKPAPLLCILTAQIVLASPPSAQLPPDVEAFIERREICEHFRGEDPYDAERAALLDRALREHCSGTDWQLAALRCKYRDSISVQTALSGYEAKIEP